MSRFNISLFVWARDQTLAHFFFLKFYDKFSLTMRFNIDCHSHSFYSPDAEESPNVIFKRAKNAGLKGLIITDHNTTSHFSSAKRAAKNNALVTCEGIEITSSYEGADIHILGYSNSFNTNCLETLLKPIRKGYNQRSKETLAKLKKAGIKISFTDLLKKSKSGYVTKPLIAKKISNLKKIDQKTALSFVERGGVAYVPYGEWAPSPKKVIETIHKARGKAVLAHPGDFFGNRNSLPISKREASFKKLVKSLIKHGLSGIEVYYPTHTAKQIASFKLITRKHKLIETGGSDWHGKIFTPHKPIGKSTAKLNQFLKLLK